MTNDHATVWDSCLLTIRKAVKPESYKTWFEPIRPVRLENNALTIQVPNVIFYEWLEEHFVDVLKTTIRKELGDRGRLEYQILPDPSRNGNGQRHNGNGHTNGSARAESYVPGMVSTDHIKNPFVIPGIKK